MRSLRLIFPAVVCAPGVILLLRTHRQIDSSPTRPWVSIMVAAFAATNAVLALTARRWFLRESTTMRLSAQGKDPEETLAIVGMVLILAPMVWAFLGSTIGLSLRTLSIYTVACTLGLLSWGWHFRRTIYRSQQ